MADARFEDASEDPIRLRAETAQDLTVLSALVQDAVLRVGDIAWMPKRRRAVLLVNRFRWEDRADAAREGRGYERVRAMLTLDGVLRFLTHGVDPADKATVLSILALSFAPAEDGAGRIEITLAGDGALALEVEAVDVTLTDVTRPHRSLASGAPDHGEA